MNVSPYVTTNVCPDCEERKQREAMRRRRDWRTFGAVAGTLALAALVVAVVGNREANERFAREKEEQREARRASPFVGASYEGGAPHVSTYGNAGGMVGGGGFFYLNFSGSAGGAGGGPSTGHASGGAGYSSPACHN